MVIYGVFFHAATFSYRIPGKESGGCEIKVLLTQAQAGECTGHTGHTVSTIPVVLRLFMAQFCPKHPPALTQAAATHQELEKVLMTNSWFLYQSIVEFHCRGIGGAISLLPLTAGHSDFSFLFPFFFSFPFFLFPLGFRSSGSSLPSIILTAISNRYIQFFCM